MKGFCIVDSLEAVKNTGVTGVSTGTCWSKTCIMLSSLTNNKRRSSNVINTQNI